MGISYTTNTILITDDGDLSRPPLKLPLDASIEEITTAHASYSSFVPEPDYVGFYSGLLGSLTYRFVATAPATAEQAKALAIFVSAIQDAMAGRVNPLALQDAIWRLLGQVSLTEANAIELSTLMSKYHLTGMYLLTPPKP